MPMSLPFPPLPDPTGGSLGEAVDGVVEQVVETTGQVVDTVVDAVTDAADDVSIGNSGVQFQAEQVGRAAASVVDTAIIERAIGDIADAARSAPPVSLDVDGGIAAPRNIGDGITELSANAHLGIRVGDTEVGVDLGQIALSDGTDTRGGSAHAGVFVNQGDQHDEFGVTSHETYDSDQVDDKFTGIYVEHAGEHAEAGVYGEKDTDANGFWGDQTVGEGGGVYVTVDNDTARAGWEHDRGRPGDPAHTGVFVEDPEGDRTGGGIIEPVTMTKTDFEVGTGGIYVDVDGEHHDAHAQGGVAADGPVEVTATIDPGPVSVSGQVGVQIPGDLDPTGIVFARGEVETETFSAPPDDVTGSAPSVTTDDPQPAYEQSADGGFLADVADAVGNVFDEVGDALGDLF
jgi:hypothetical protein